MDSIYFIDQGPFGVPDEGWNDLVGMLDWLCDNWDQPDEGIWETRGGRKPFVYGRLMSWVAIDQPSGWPPSAAARRSTQVDR